MAKSILIVDDEELILDLLERVFGSQHTIYRAEDGEEALRIFQAESPNLVISDLCMPKMGGLEFIRKVKSEGACHVVALTGQKGSLLDEARALGADEVLEKPVDIRSLLDIARKYLVVNLSD